MDPSIRNTRCSFRIYRSQASPHLNLSAAANQINWRIEPHGWSMLNWLMLKLGGTRMGGHTKPYRACRGAWIGNSEYKDLVWLASGVTWPSIQVLTNGLEIRAVSGERTTPTIKTKQGPESISSIGSHNRDSKALRVVTPILDIYLSTEHPTTYLRELTSMKRAWSQRNQDQSSDIQELHHILIHFPTPLRAFLTPGS
jgi:hypothetical protein